jgi:sigma-E factor negative regulatory protein RseA
MNKQDTVETNELISALSDGQLRGHELSLAMHEFRQNEQARVTWQSYHLVGDVMRGGEAMVGSSSAEFVQRLRHRMQQDTAVQGAGPNALADRDTVPGVAAIVDASQVGAANDSWFGWRPAALAASLLAVLVTAWQMLGAAGVQASGPALAQVSVPAVVTASAAGAVVAQQVAPDTEPQIMLRDPQLDAMLAAHKQMGGTSALQMPSGFLRNATFEGTAR